MPLRDTSGFIVIFIAGFTVVQGSSADRYVLAVRLVER
jgi:hypothetical protein